ncbi:hypothetical protein CDAR_604451 [Caerostris darwini]|uniref:Uncharacterized protein n=1 Tax=Caerostris darwini TaxID=1538125 RepID=A0AAV4NBE3_9ARAC|nr:hypothetical protein CDAR_604451 [Caerostris darwini]
MYPILIGLKFERYAIVLDLLTNIMITVAIIFSAENVQLKANQIRLSFLTLAQCDKSPKANGKWIKILEDRHVLTLTAWGMVAVRKPILPYDGRLALYLWIDSLAVFIKNFKKKLI